MRGARGAIPVDPARRCRLATGQLQKWAEGQISARSMTSTMHDAIGDGYQHPMIARLASCAPRAASDRGVAAAVVSLLDNECCAAEAIVSVAGPAVITHMVRPSKLIETISATTYPGQADEILGFGKEVVASLWRGMFSSEQGREIKRIPMLSTTVKKLLQLSRVKRNCLSQAQTLVQL